MGDKSLTAFDQLPPLPFELPPSPKAMEDKMVDKTTDKTADKKKTGRQF
jgi:hypothetical protein